MKLHSNSDFDADQLDEHDDNVFQDVYDTGFDDGYIKANQENLIANQYKNSIKIVIKTVTIVFILKMN